VRDWLAERGGAGTDPLFPSRRGTRLSRDAVEHLVARHAAAAARRCPSIAAKHVTPPRPAPLGGYLYSYLSVSDLG
jgi:hypothetical protein